jgi:hypothetical protein
MLELKTEVFPALNVGQKTEMRTLLELVGQDHSGEETPTSERLIGERWRARVAQEGARISTIANSEECQNSVILALELMTRQNPFNFIYVKQYRDAVDPNLFCYQAFVNACRTVHSVLEIQEIQDAPQIRLHKYPDHNIRDALGLVCERMDSEGDSVVFVLAPIRPFWMRLQINEELSKVLCSRSGEEKNGEWMTDHSWFRTKNLGEWKRQEQEDEPYFRAPWSWTSVGLDLAPYIKRFPHPEQAEDESLWDDQTKQAADCWLRDILLMEIGTIPLGKLKKSKDRLSESTRTNLERSGWQLKSVASGKSTDELYWFVEELSFALYDPKDIIQSKGQRFRRSEARTWVSGLTDVKALIELILYRYGAAAAARATRG